MLVGDFLDALAGYNEGEAERIKNIAGFIRISTNLLLNIQLASGDKMTPQQMWPFPWDKSEEAKSELISDEERKRRQELQDKILMEEFPDK